jgi:hypothetical protein
MKSLKRLVLGAIALLSACVTVRSSEVPGTNLAQYRTFAWAQPDGGEGNWRWDHSAGNMDRSPAGQTIRNQIVRNLEAKGVVPAAQGQSPDFLVRYQVVLRDRLDYAGWGWGGWGYGYWNGADVYTYTEGTIVVDFIDPRTREVFWRGSASRDVDHPENPDLHDVAGAVDKMMKKYPVRVAQAGERPAG